MIMSSWTALWTCTAWILCSQAIASTHHEPLVVAHVNHHANHVSKTHNDFNATSAIDIPKYGFDFIPGQTNFDSSIRQCSSLFIIPSKSITSAKYAIQYDINMHKTQQPRDEMNPETIYRFKTSLAHVPLRNASLCKLCLQITRKIYPKCIKHAKSQVNGDIRTFACLLSNHCPDPLYSLQFSACSDCGTPLEAPECGLSNVFIHNPVTYDDRIWILFVMIVLCVIATWIFIKSLIKNKTRRLPIMTFIETKACLFVLVALSFRTTYALSVSAGFGYTCALLNTSPDVNGLKCFGRGEYGELGYENTTNIGDGPNEMGLFLPNIDTDINIDNIIQVDTGAVHTCVLSNTGKAKCWGLNEYGQLGLGDNNTRGNAPNTMGIDLPFIDFGGAWSATQIAAGGHHTCALLNNGTTGKAKCWGWNEYGQLGYEDTNHRGDEANEMGDSLPPIELGTGFDPIQIIAGYAHTCALSRSNKVKCFGYNYNGELGLGIARWENIGDSAGEMGDQLRFVELGTGFTPVHIETGGHHVCALSDSGDVKCWGQGDFGQLGSGHNRNIGNEMNEMGDALPIVELGSNLIAKQITAGFYHTCALFTVGNIKCCGKGRYGQLGYQNEDNLGDSSGEMSDSLPFVDLGSIGYDGAITEVQAGAWHTCATFSSDELKCWGWNFYGQLGQEHSNNIGNDTDEMSDYLPIVDLGFQSSNPTSTPTEIPTSQPSNPSSAPTSPTYIPTSPTYNPSTSPTSPTDIPTTIPTYNPSKPSISPTNIPTDIPTSPTYNPSNPSTSPTSQTDIPTDIPTYNPSTSPTNIPTDIPTYSPTYSPSKPSISPTSLTDIPTHNPSNPSVSPTSQTDIPTIHPTIDPTPQPTPYRNYECDEIPYILVVFFDIATNKEDFEDELVDILITVMTNTIKSLIVMEWSDDWCINLIKQNLIPYGNRRRLLQDHVRYRATFNMNNAIKKDVFDNPDFRFNVFKKRFTENLKERLSTTTLIEDEAQFSMDSVTDIEDIAENTTSHKSEPLFDFTDPLMISLIILIGIALSIMISGKIHARCIDSDDFRLGPVFLFTIYVWDFYTDLLFAISLYTTYVSPERIGYMVLFIASIVFLICPLLRNFYDLVKFEEVWRAHPILDELYKEWLLHNAQYVYILSLLSGSTYAAINLVNSNFLGLKVFSMGLSAADVLKFNQKRLMNVVLLENVPQLIIQIIFLVFSKQLTDLSILAIASSAVSIFLAVLKYINHEKSMDDKNVSEVMFSFEIFHEGGDDLKGYTHKTHAVSKAIESTLGLRRRTVECLPIDAVVDDKYGDGLRLHCVVRTTKKSPNELKNGLIDSSRMTDGSGHLQLRKQIAAKWCITESSQLITVFDSDNFYGAKTQDDIRTNNVDTHAVSLQMETVA